MAKWFSPETDPLLFKCPCNHIDCDAPQPTQSLLDVLDRIREIYAKPISISSGPRCKKHNDSKKVGGVKDSEHLTGEGADLVCNTSLDRWNMLNAILQVGVTRIGIGKTFLHVGVDDISHATKMIWTYYI